MIYYAETQYCDGLRGPLIIKDPYDPFLSLYDFDDGEIRLVYYFYTL